MNKRIAPSAARQRTQTAPPPIPTTICTDCIHRNEIFNCEGEARDVRRFGPPNAIRFVVLSCSGYVQEVKQDPEKETA